MQPVGRQDTSSFALLLIGGSGLVSAARGMSIAFLAVRLQQAFGLSPALIGALLGIGPLLGAAAAPFVGALSDQIGRRLILIIVLLSMTLSLVGMALAQSIAAFSVAQIVAAVAGAIYEPVSRALMSDVCPEQQRLRLFSWRYLATNLGWGVGPLIGVTVGAASTSLFLVASLAYAVYAVALALMVGEAVAHRPNCAAETARTSTSIMAGLALAIRDRRLTFFLAGGSLLLAVHGQWSVSLSQYLTGSMAEGIRFFALLVSVNAVVVILANQPSQFVITRAGALPSLVLGCLLFLAGEVGFLLSGGLWGLVAAMVLFSLGEVLAVPAEYMLIDHIADDTNRGSYFGAQAITSVGNFAGPTFGGMMLAIYGGPGMFLFFAFLAAVSALLFVVGNRMPPPRLSVERQTVNETGPPGLSRAVSPAIWSL